MERKTRENKIKGIPAIDMLEKVLELEEKLSDINNHDWQWSMGSQTAITEKLNRILEDLEADDIYEWNNPFDDDDMIFHKNGEEIVNLLIEHHLRVVDGTQYGPALEFVWTTKSPLYRGMNRIKDTNLGGYFADRIMELMDTLADKMMKEVNEDVDRLGEWEQCGYCPACDCWGIVPDKDGKCDCGNTVWFHDDYQGGYESADGTKTVCKCQGLPKPDDEMTEDEEEEETEEPEEVPAPAAEPAEAQPFVLVDWIIAYESGQLEDDRIVEGFQHMIDDGTVWQFQGSYGRMATALIEAGYCHQ